MTGDELRLQPGVTPEHRTRLAEALAAAKAYPGGPERLARTIAAALAAAPPPSPGRAAARAETPGGEPEARAARVRHRGIGPGFR